MQVKDPESRYFYDNEIEIPTSWPTDAGWEHYQIWIDGHLETLNTIRAGAAMKGSGFILSGGIAEEDQGTLARSIHLRTDRACPRWFCDECADAST